MPHARGAAAHSKNHKHADAAAVDGAADATPSAPGTRVNKNNHDFTPSGSMTKVAEVDESCGAESLIVTTEEPAAEDETLNNASSPMTNGAPANGEKPTIRFRGDSTNSMESAQTGPHSLDRSRFLERIEMEYRLEASAWKVGNFLFLVFTLMFCMASYDPLNQISETHRNLRNRLQTEDAQNVRTHEEIMEYIKTFLEMCYRMAPALVDANTLDEIDYARCTDPKVDDVCRLTYWVGHRDLEYNRDQVLRDKLSPLNARPACRDLSDTECIDYDLHVDPNFKKKTYGLTPEDPVVLESRLDYPMPSVVLLTPVVWQSRAARKQCKGIGDRYNKEVLGAGMCGFDKTCDIIPSRFNAVKSAQDTNRMQSYYLTYSEDVFLCVDRQDLVNEFYDKSWFPWATYNDLQKGKLSHATMFRGEPVFYKFISDIAYLQRPINNTIKVQESITDTTCDLEVDLGRDPVVNPDHAMWTQDENNNVYGDGCSLRKAWTAKYLNKEASERANSFLTLETTTLTIAAVVITAQSDLYADVTTLVRVIWTIDQGGTISTSVDLQSTSQTFAGWYVSICFVLVSALCEFVGGVIMVLQHCRLINGRRKRRLHREATWMGIFDMLTATAAVSFVVANVAMDLKNTIREDMLKAYEVDRQVQYFTTMETIVEYNVQVDLLKQFGFCVICLMFVRLVSHLSLHPRMAVLVNTLTGMADNIFHFAIYFGLISFVFTFLAWWMFAASDSIRYGTISRTLWTQFKMFVGEFEFDEEVPRFALFLYLFLYSFVVVVILVNFLLAIVVDSYANVQLRIEALQTEQYVTTDLFDIVQRKGMHIRLGFPTALEVLTAVEEGEASEEREPDKQITAERLFEFLNQVMPPANGRRKPKKFNSVEHTQEFIDTYIKQLSVLRYIDLSADSGIEVCSPFDAFAHPQQQDHAELLEELRRTTHQLKENTDRLHRLEEIVIKHVTGQSVGGTAVAI